MVKWATSGDLLNDTNEATWYEVVWFSQNIPKHAFVLWLAVQTDNSRQVKEVGYL